MLNHFEQLLEEVGTLLKTKLTLDTNHACMVRFKENSMAVQLEESISNGELLMGSVIGTLSEGPYRDKVFKAALLINGAQQPGIKGTLAYGEHTEKLYLCDVMDMSYINGSKLANHLKQFSRYAAVWSAAVQTNTIPDLHDLGIYSL